MSSLGLGFSVSGCFVPSERSVLCSELSLCRSSAIVVSGVKSFTRQTPACVLTRIIMAVERRWTYMESQAPWEKHWYRLRRSRNTTHRSKSEAIGYACRKRCYIPCCSTYPPESMPHLNMRHRAGSGVAWSQESHLPIRV